MSSYRSVPKVYVVTVPPPIWTVRGGVVGNGLGFLPRRRYESTSVSPIASASWTPKTVSRARRITFVRRSDDNTVRWLTRTI